MAHESLHHTSSTTSCEDFRQYSFFLIAMAQLELKNTQLRLRRAKRASRKLRIAEAHSVDLPMRLVAAEGGCFLGSPLEAIVIF